MDLHTGEEQVGEDYRGTPLVMTDREWAARVLHQLADDCHDGASPTVSTFDAGRALARALSNVTPGENKYSDLLDGILRYERMRNRPASAL